MQNQNQTKQIETRDYNNKQNNTSETEKTQSQTKQK